MLLNWESSMVMLKAPPLAMKIMSASARVQNCNKIAVPATSKSTVAFDPILAMSEQPKAFARKCRSSTTKKRHVAMKSKRTTVLKQMDGRRAMSQCRTER